MRYFVTKIDPRPLIAPLFATQMAGFLFVGSFLAVVDRALSSLISTLIAHDAHTLHWKQDGACLPDLIIPACLAQDVEIYLIYVLQNLNLLACDLAKDTYRKAWTREWVTADEAFGHAHRTAHATYLILEE